VGKSFWKPAKKCGILPYIYMPPRHPPATIQIGKKGREKTEKTMRSNLGTNRGVGGEKEKDREHQMDHEVHKSKKRKRFEAT
jgi:hypothetical protein